MDRNIRLGINFIFYKKPNKSLFFEKVVSISALEARIQQAGANHQLVMLDFMLTGAYRARKWKLIH
jgi:hypothetical protein